ncbi:MAG: hypothetical protein PHE87_06990 [Victivallaceae bacterium]|nr:hypothetical protein [Victivallaceae bacterium]
MLLPDNIHPERTIYVNGAFVLKELQQHNRINFLELYMKVKANIDMSIFVFSLSLDWLYLIGVIKINKNQEVELCS